MASFVNANAARGLSIWLVGALLCVVPAGARSHAAPTASAAHADLSGTWILDPDLSRQSTRMTTGWGDREGGDEGPGRERRPGGRERRPDDGPGLAPDAQNPDGAAALRRRFERLTFAATPSGLTLTYADGHSVALVTDGQKHKVERPEGGAAEIAAHWTDEGDLVVETTARDRVSTETYILTHDRKMLTVELEGRGSRGASNGRRVYRPVADVPGAEVAPPGPQPVRNAGSSVPAR